MPVHGSGRFLLQSIESYNQFSIPESTLVLILDRPDEQLLSIVKDARLSKNSRILISPGSGIVDALNYGISNSQAEYIARLDSDDLLMAGRLQQQVDILDLNSGVICVGSQIELIDEDGQTIGFTRYPTSSKEISKRLQFQNCLAHPSVMFRRIFHSKTFLYRNIFTGAEDYDLWLQMSKLGEIINLEEKLTKYRVSSGQYSATFGKSIGRIEDLSRAANLFSLTELDFNNRKSGDQCKELFRSIITSRVFKSPSDCAKLLSSHFVGKIIVRSAGSSRVAFKLVSASPYAILALIFSPQIFKSFCSGLVKHRTIKVAK